MNTPLILSSWTSIRNKILTVNDKKEVFDENFLNFAAFIKTLYKKKQVNYPKFYKMDNLSKLGFLTAEILLKNSSVLLKYSREEIGVVIGNSSSSLDADLAYMATIRDRSNYFPSPSVFVYTLPNILIGEICIRHQLRGENVFFVAERFDPVLFRTYTEQLLKQGRINACIAGWVELLEDRYESFLFAVEKQEDERGEDHPINELPLFNDETINRIYQK